MTTTFTFNERQHAAVLAALRMVQEDGGFNPSVHDIATNDGKFDPLSDDEIDKLCERLNFPSENDELAEALKNLRTEIDAISGYWTEGLSNFAQQADAVLAKIKAGGAL